MLENKIGRLLKRWGEEVAHHADEDRTNDDPDNLVLKTGVTHALEHAVVRSPGKILVQCATCGKGFSLKPHQFRLRQKRAKLGVLFCSRSCAGNEVGAPIVCAWCGKAVIRKRRNSRPGQTDFFCDKSCAMARVWSQRRGVGQR